MWYYHLNQSCYSYKFQPVRRFGGLKFVEWFHFYNDLIHLIDDSYLWGKPSRGTRTWDNGDLEESLLCPIKSTQQDRISGDKSQALNSPKLEVILTIFHRHFYGVQIFDQNAKKKINGNTELEHVYLHRISQNHKGSSEDADLTLKRSEDISTKPVRPFLEKRLGLKSWKQKWFLSFTLRCDHLDLVVLW